MLTTSPGNPIRPGLSTPFRSVQPVSTFVDVNRAIELRPDMTMCHPVSSQCLVSMRSSGAHMSASAFLLNAGKLVVPRPTCPCRPLCWARMRIHDPHTDPNPDTDLDPMRAHTGARVCARPGRPHGVPERAGHGLRSYRRRRGGPAARRDSRARQDRDAALGESVVRQDCDSTCPTDGCKSRFVTRSNTSATSRVSLVNRPGCYTLAVSTGLPGTARAPWQHVVPKQGDVWHFSLLLFEKSSELQTGAGPGRGRNG